MEWYLWLVLGYVLSALLTGLFYLSLGYVKEHASRGDTKERAVLEMILISLFQPVGIFATLVSVSLFIFYNGKLLVYKITHK